MTVSNYVKKHTITKCDYLYPIYRTVEKTKREVIKLDHHLHTFWTNSYFLMPQYVDTL